MKIIELVLPEDTEDAGVEAIAFVDKPATETDLIYFREEFIKPHIGETQKDFIPRCVETVMSDNTTDNNKQAIAICYSMWEKKEKMSAEGANIDTLPPYISEVPKSKIQKKKLKSAFIKLVSILGRPDNEIIDNIVKRKPIKGFNQDNWTSHIEYKFKNMLFSIDELDEMNKIMEPYIEPSKNIFNFLDGLNWSQIKYLKSPEGKIQMIYEKAISKNLDKFNKEEKIENFKFVNEDKRIVISPLMIPNKLIPRINHTTGESYMCFFTEETIASLCEKYMSDLRINDGNIMHNPQEPVKMTCIETWIVCENPEMDKSAFYGFNVPAGTWMATLRINDEDTWNKIKTGKLKGLSIEGNFGKILRQK